MSLQVPAGALDDLATDIHAAIQRRWPIGVTPEQVRPHVAGFLATVLNEADEDERSPL